MYETAPRHFEFCGEFDVAQTEADHLNTSSTLQQCFHLSHEGKLTDRRDALDVHQIGSSRTHGERVQQSIGRSFNHDVRIELTESRTPLPFTTRSRKPSLDYLC
jgi:hypothetical protein